MNGRDDSSWRHASGPDGPRNRQVQAKHSPLAVDPEARDAVGPRTLPPPRTSRPETGPATNWPSSSASRRATCSPSPASGAGSGSSPAPAPAPTGSTRRQPRHPRHRRPTLNFAALRAQARCAAPFTPEGRPRSLRGTPENSSGEAATFPKLLTPRTKRNRYGRRPGRQCDRLCGARTGILRAGPVHRAALQVVRG